MNTERITRDLFVIGGSAGGLEALLEILRRLAADLPATIAVALHRSPVDSSVLAAILSRASALPTREPAHREPVRLGYLYLAPRDFHLTLRDEHWCLDRDPKQHRMRPAVDPLMISAADARGSRVVGVLLSGGGADGVEGLIAIKAKGGISIVQQPEQARQPSMPCNAIREDDVDAVLKVEDIAKIIPLLAAGHALEVPGSM